MPRSPLHALIWSADQTLYELFTQGHLKQRFRPEDEKLWLDWLHNANSFGFQGRSGRLNVYKETRRRAGRYWYAYHTARNRTHKRYLGQTTNVTFAHLEETATLLANIPSPVPLASMLPSHQAEAASHGIELNMLRGAEQRAELLATKFASPRLPTALVERERLLNKLDAVLSNPLLLLSASAGSGKTTLLSVWIARCASSSHKVAWLTLDELDNDPTRFWVSVITALRTCLPQVGKTALTLLRSPQPPLLSTMLTVLLNEATALTGEIVLILDDYHLITDQAIHESLLFLLEHLPKALHLMLASRVDPPLSLARLRVRGQMLELRDADLRFQQAEVANFLTDAMKLPLSEAEVSVLEQRTEGWIAGLLLAALALQQREDRSAFVWAFTGSQRYVLEYVQEEMLARLPVAVQRFLLHTAILNQLSASLYQAVTEEADSQMLLERLERANLFLVPLDEERRWYRLHALIREALLAHLRATQPTLIPRLHQRAAHWYEERGELREAVAQDTASGQRR